MKKRILSFILALVLVLGLVAALPAEKAAADSLYIRKIVSVVYDDSGSMSGGNIDRWSYASYAMQTFAGLMNTDDRLFVTYMSDAIRNPDNATRELDVTNPEIQKTVDAIRAHAEVDNTPYYAINLAYKALLQVQDDNVNTQYWLVVLTDGEFGVSEAEMNRDMENYVNTTMPNGSNPKITFLAMGDNITAPTENTAKDIYVYKAKKSADIVDTMAEMADRISGRCRLGDEVKREGNNALKFTTQVPLLNIAVLCQNSAAALESAVGPDGDLSISRTVSIRYPEVQGWKTDKSLVGSAFVAGGTGNLPAGEYTLTFADGINPKDVVVMIEPALEIRLTIYRGGIEVKPEDFQDLAAGERLDVKATIYESGTDKEIDPALLPENTTYKIVAEENGSEVQSSETADMLLEGITLNQVPTEFRAQVDMEGFNPITLTSGIFTPQRAIEYTITATAPDYWKMDIEGLKQNTDKVVFTVFADGIQVTEELDYLGFRVLTEVPGDVAFEADGTITFQPKYQDPITAIPTGDLEIKGTLPSGAEAAVTLTITPPEYKLEAEVPVDVSIARTDLGTNTTGVTFRLFVDGVQQDKAAVEAAELEISIPESFGRHVTLTTEISDDGEIKVIPGYEGWKWLAAWRIPTGDLVITAAALGEEAQGILPITWDWSWEIPFNYVIPLLIIAFILGQIFKKRLPYGKKVHYNFGTLTGNYITGPGNGWNTESLWTWTALIPFITDVKNVNGAKFYGTRMFGSQLVNLKCKQYPVPSGVVEGDVTEQGPVHIHRSSVDAFEEGTKKWPIFPGTALVVSADPNYRSCQIYLYGDE